MRECCTRAARKKSRKVGKFVFFFVIAVLQ